MGSPEIAESHIDEFNAAYPQFTLSGGKQNDLDENMKELTCNTDADKLLTAYRLQRARMLPLQEMLPSVISFVKTWESWKVDNRFVDFTDMISHTLLWNGPPPGDRKVGIYDECQDFSKIEMSLLRMWAKHQEYVILAGDDDQALYGFAGGTADAFLNPPLPKEQKRVLGQSYRVPRAVQAVANTWIHQITNREEKEYKPRDAEGEVRHIQMSHGEPRGVIEDAKQYLDEGKSIMFLASCGYMLNKFKTVLRAEGLPFHNPFKTSRGDWNPLGTWGGRRGPGSNILSKDRVLCYMDDTGPMVDGKTFWTISAFHQWISIINSRGLLKRGAKLQIEEQVEFPTLYTPEEIATFERECFESNILETALSRNLQWFQKNLMSGKQEALDFPIKVYNKHGASALTNTPQIILSTIHGVKGGETDVVYLFPDLSYQGLHEWQQKGEGHDAIIRMFYVGMTRAKESLVLCDPATEMCVTL